MTIERHNNDTAGASDYTLEVRHVQNGELGIATTYQRPALDLEKRTEALRLHADATHTSLKSVEDTVTEEKTKLTALQSSYTAHDVVGNHPTFASASEVNAGTVTDKVTSPKTITDMVVARIGLLYDAIVGPSTSVGTTHANIPSAVTSLGATGGKILVTTSQILGATLEINKPNVEIEFKRGTSITLASGVTTAFKILTTAPDCYISKARFVDCNTAIDIVTGALRTTLRDIRYKGCTTTVSDPGAATSKTSNLGEIIE